MSRSRPPAEAFSDWIEDHSAKLLLALSFLVVVIYALTAGMGLDTDYPVIDTVGALVLATGAMWFFFVLPYYALLFAALFVVGVVDELRGSD